MGSEAVDEAGRARRQNQTRPEVCTAARIRAEASSRPVEEFSTGGSRPRYYLRRLRLRAAYGAPQALSTPELRACMKTLQKKCRKNTRPGIDAEHGRAYSAGVPFFGGSRRPGSQRMRSPNAEGLLSKGPLHVTHQ